MNKVFSNVAASLVAFTALSQTAYADHSTPVDVIRDLKESDSFCYITLPPELNRAEIESRYGDFYDAPREVARPQRDFYFSAKGILDIERAEGRLSVTIDRSGIIGQEFTVHRHTRDDDTVTITQGLAAPQARVEIDTIARSVTLDLSNAVSGPISFDDARLERVERQIQEEELYTGIFGDFGVAAFHTPLQNYFGVNINSMEADEIISYLNEEDFALSIIDVESEGASAFFYQKIEITGPQAYSDEGWIEPPLAIDAQLVCSTIVGP